MQDGPFCPLCIEVLDSHEQGWYPCQCGYALSLSSRKAILSLSFFNAFMKQREALTTTTDYCEIASAYFSAFDIF